MLQAGSVFHTGKVAAQFNRAVQALLLGDYGLRRRFLREASPEELEAIVAAQAEATFDGPSAGRTIWVARVHRQGNLDPAHALPRVDEESRAAVALSAANAYAAIGFRLGEWPRLQPLVPEDALAGQVPASLRALGSDFSGLCAAATFFAGGSSGSDGRAFQYS